MSGGRGRGMLALLAGNLACIGIVLVFPFCSSIGGLWRGPADEVPASDYLRGALTFGLPLAVCIALAMTSLALRDDRPGSAVPALLALTLIGLQLLVFLALAGFSMLTVGGD